MENEEYIVKDHLHYDGIASFNSRPVTQELTGVDIAVMGVPFDSCTTYRTGTRFGPRGIRLQSQLACCFHTPWDYEIFKEKNIGDFIQNLLRPGGGGGHDDNAQLIVPADNGGRHHIALLIVEVADGACGAVNAAFVDFFQKILVKLPAVVVTAVQGAGAECNVAVVVADYNVGVGSQGYHVQIQHQRPTV